MREWRGEWRRWRDRAGAEAAFLIGVGLLMGVIGPYGTSAMPAPLRFGYWLACILGGGLIGIGVDEIVRRRLAAPWRRILAVTLAMTPATMVLVLEIGRVLVGRAFAGTLSAGFLGQVLAISLLVTTLRVLIWRPARLVVQTRTIVETRTVVAPPLPQAEAAFRQLLAAKYRRARLIAVQAEDHYLRVHTDAGEALLAMRFVDALASLAAAHGFQTHRSWWVAGDAVDSVKWRKGAGEARLATGLVVPVSRSHAARLREAGY